MDVALNIVLQTFHKTTKKLLIITSVNFFCCLLWYSYKLQTVQNKVRFILDLAPWTHLTVNHTKQLNVLRVSDRARQPWLNMAHKIYYMQVPEYLQETLRKLKIGSSIGGTVYGILPYQISREMRIRTSIYMQSKTGNVWRMS